MAGESARESARRQREKAERLRRSAERWERGAEGEQRTAGVLAQLPAATWTVFHDLRWPGRRFANVDHVIVGPPGVFVIDSKNWSGSITFKENVLRCNGYSKEREVVGAAESALAIAQLVPLLRPDLAKPVLCFVRDEPLTGWVRDVMVTSTSTLVPMLESRPAVLSPDDVRHLSLDLDASFRSAVAAEISPRSAAPARRSAPSRSPVAQRIGNRRSSRRKRGGTGLVPFLAVVLLMAIFLGSPGLRSHASDWLISVFTSNLADNPSPEKNGKNGKRCAQRANSPVSCESNR